MAIKSDAQKRAVTRYVSKTYDKITVTVKKGEREKYKEFAEKNGYESFNQFCVDAIEEKIERGK